MFAARQKKRHVDGKLATMRDETAASVAAQKDEEAAALRQQLLETRRALAAETHARELLAQDMKRSFMRGVCALNMEAMQARRPVLAACYAALVRGQSVSMRVAGRARSIRRSLR